MENSSKSVMDKLFSQLLRILSDSLDFAVIKHESPPAPSPPAPSPPATPKKTFFTFFPKIFSSKPQTVIDETKQQIYKIYIHKISDFKIEKKIRTGGKAGLPLCARVSIKEIKYIEELPYFLRLKRKIVCLLIF
jgi:hypothetical protein